MTDQEQDATETDEAGAVEPAEPDKPEETEAQGEAAGDVAPDEGEA